MILILGRRVGGRPRLAGLPHPSGSGSSARVCRVARPLLLGLLGLGRCEAPPVQPRLAPPRTSAAPAAAPAPVRQAAAADEAGLADSRPPLLNDPSAAPDTPLCGQQARERDAIGVALQGPRVAASGVCAGFACYDPLTATYIGADGYRHVCR